MSVEQAGEYYLDWICWSNSALDSWSALMQKTPGSQLGSKKIRNRAAREAEIQRAVATALENPPAPWPSNVADDVLKVANEALRDVSAFNQWSKAKNLQQVTDAAVDLGKGGNQSAQRVRLRLNLPAAGGKKDGCWIRRDADGKVPPPAGAPDIP